MSSQRFDLNKEQLIKIGKVFAWTISSTAVGSALTLLPQLKETIQVPSEYVLIAGILFSLINTILVALKKFIENKEGNLL